MWGKSTAYDQYPYQYVDLAVPRDCSVGCGLELSL
jgi:hypothetical protein